MALKKIRTETITIRIKKPQKTNSDVFCPFLGHCRFNVSQKKGGGGEPDPRHLQRIALAASFRT